MLVAANLTGYKREQEQELKRILSYWMEYTIDREEGGFYGRVDNDNNIDRKAAKGSVLNSRILWSFSAAYRCVRNDDYLKVAARAFTYIRKYFLDIENGGVYWSVDHKGRSLDTKKQFYALAFAVYGMTEYYLATGLEESKKIAIDLYNTIERFSHDTVNKGYIEALAADWSELEDNRLSDKDANEKKSMNTHLHILEGYANLYRIWPNEKLKENIIEILQLFLQHIIDPVTNHLVLFFNDEWNRKSNVVSFGHDIEAAWLLLEAAEVIQTPVLIKQLKEKSIKLAEAAAEGLDIDGGLWYELEQQQLVEEKHWWVQAEAMVGFINAWELTGHEKYLDYSLKTWYFVKEKILHPAGEWVWGVGKDNAPMIHQDKVGLWKCPYHNSRACMEVIRRLMSKE